MISLLQRAEFAGDFDYLPEIYKAVKVEVLFNKVAMRPGSVRFNGCICRWKVFVWII